MVRPRGTLQEELNNVIADEIKSNRHKELRCLCPTTHGCCENRGIMATSSLTQTTVLVVHFLMMLALKKNF